MKYKCKVFTPSFQARVEEYIKHKISHVTGVMGRIFARGDELQYLLQLWNGDLNIDDFNIKSREDLIEYNILTPEFTEEILDAQERGLQAQPRVMWKGEIKKINEIDEIFSFCRE